MKNVKVCLWVLEDGKWLSREKSFEELLQKSFFDYESKNEKWYISLSKLLRKTQKEDVKRYPNQDCDKEEHYGDMLTTLFNELSMNYDFAKDLNLFDIVSADYFIGEHFLVEAFEYFLYYHRFIVFQKSYQEQETIKICFQVCHEDYVFSCHQAVMRHEIDM
jgi:hypothetical protein